MPYINVKTTKKISEDKCVLLKASLGKAIECFPGKTEEYLMVSIEDNQKLWFKGDNSRDSAVVDVDLLGTVSAEHSENMTSLICKALDEIIGVPPDRVYVKYTGFENWGWNGKNF